MKWWNAIIFSGEFDFMLKVVAENMDAYYDFSRETKLSPIENMGTCTKRICDGDH